MGFNSKKSIDITTTKRISISVLSIELITLLLLIYFDIYHAGSQSLYVSITANILLISMCVANIYGSLRYVKRILLLYSLWSILHILWIIFCILISVRVIKITSYAQDASETQLVSQDSYESWFRSTPIPYGYSFAWHLQHWLNISVLASLMIIYVWEIMLSIATAILSMFVRRAYLIEQRHWDDLDNQVLTRASTRSSSS
ncbi:hypothetical protein K7432_007034 [Basidiobolus ranarum]|uniref:Uncharacterized protein n=1 Tax=Basidiobolus ranarum TaxID=34480 RepID=A0ABR2WU54_9FUNG